MRWVRPTPCASLPAFEWEESMRRREFIAALGSAAAWRCCRALSDPAIP